MMFVQSQACQTSFKPRNLGIESLTPDVFEQVLNLADQLQLAISSRVVSRELIARDALYSFFETWPDGNLAELMAFGHDDLGQGTLEELVARACQNLQYGACYLVGKVTLAEHLQCGCERLLSQVSGKIEAPLDLSIAHLKYQNIRRNGGFGSEKEERR